MGWGSESTIPASLPIPAKPPVHSKIGRGKNNEAQPRPFTGIPYGIRRGLLFLYAVIYPYSYIWISSHWNAKRRTPLKKQRTLRRSTRGTLRTLGAKAA